MKINSKNNNFEFRGREDLLNTRDMTREAMLAVVNSSLTGDLFLFIFVAILEVGMTNEFWGIFLLLLLIPCCAICLCGGLGYFLDSFAHRDWRRVARFFSKKFSPGVEAPEERK